MKLIIQIPCYNEAQTLGVVLRELPRELPGLDRVEWLVVDDGSSDETVAVAREHGVDHIVCLHRNRGLARAFSAGVDACLRLGADIIVNTDADNQYCSQDIPTLVHPIISGKAEIVIGARPIGTIKEFSAMKKALQRCGSWAVRIASNTDIPDAPSGFRAISRDAAMRLNVFNSFTYTVESIIQAGQKGMAVTSVPIRTNPELRPSRLVKSIPNYVRRSLFTILRIFMTYKPLRAFGIPGMISFTIGLLIGVRFLFFFVFGTGTGHVQSLILAALLMGIGFSLVMIGLLADLIAVNRKLLEDIQYKVRKMECAQRQGR